MTMQATADVVIVGAGVIGCSTASHLARMGIADVAVLEMDQAGSGSCSKSASLLSLQLCQIAGQLVAEYISSGHTSTMGITSFGIDRFG